MKKKKLNYILGFSAVLIWGTIFYKVFDAYQGEDTETGTGNIRYKEKAYNDFAVKRDTANLQLNYRDPFRLLAHRQPDSLKKNTNFKNPLPLSSTPATINWDFVRYSGYIANPATKQIISMLTINGKSVMLAEGETIENVTLLKNMGESVKIRFKNIVQTIARTNSNI